MERVKYDEIVIHPSKDVRQRKMQDEMARCGEGVLITDCLANSSRGGLQIMQILTHMHSDRRYKIRVLSDKWGNPVKPGDKIEWHVSTMFRDAFGKKITNRQKTEMARRGTLRDIETWHEAEVDEHGCIDVSLADAGILLNTRGLHFESKEPLCTHHKRVASEPTKTPDGTMRLQHYWLYEEVPPWEYEKLIKKRKKRSDAGKPRGTQTNPESADEASATE